MNGITAPTDPCPPDAEWRVYPLNRRYLVSEHGHMRRIGKDHFLIPYLCKKQSTSYFTYSPSRHGVSRTYGCHVIVARTFIGPAPSRRHHVAHEDGNTAHNHFSNLKYAMPKENKKDSYRHGTIPFGERNGAYTHPEAVLRGEDNGTSKLTAVQVRAIRLSDLSFRALGRKYGVNKSTITQIIYRKTWKHIP